MSGLKAAYSARVTTANQKAIMKCTRRLEEAEALELS